MNKETSDKVDSPALPEGLKKMPYAEILGEDEIFRRVRKAASGKSQMTSRLMYSLLAYLAGGPYVLESLEDRRNLNIWLASIWQPYWLDLLLDCIRNRPEGYEELKSFARAPAELLAPLLLRPEFKGTEILDTIMRDKELAPYMEFIVDELHILESDELFEHLVSSNKDLDHAALESLEMCVCCLSYPEALVFLRRLRLEATDFLSTSDWNKGLWFHQILDQSIQAIETQIKEEK